MVEPKDANDYAAGGSCTAEHGVPVSERGGVGKTDRYHVYSVHHQRGGPEKPVNVRLKAVSEGDAQRLGSLYESMKSDLSNPTKREEYERALKNTGRDVSVQLSQGSVEEGKNLDVGGYKDLRKKAIDQKYESGLSSGLKKIGGAIMNLFGEYGRKAHQKDSQTKTSGEQQERYGPVDHDRMYGSAGSPTLEEKLAKVGLTGNPEEQYWGHKARNPRFGKVSHEREDQKSPLPENLIDVSEPPVGENYEKDWNSEAGLQRALRGGDYAKSKLVAEQRPTRTNLPAVVGDTSSDPEAIKDSLVDQYARKRDRRKATEDLIKKTREGESEKKDIAGYPKLPGDTTIPRGAFGKHHPSDYTNVSEAAAAGLKEFPTNQEFLGGGNKPTEEEHKPPEQKPEEPKDTTYRGYGVGRVEDTSIKGFDGKERWPKYRAISVELEDRKKKLESTLEHYERVLSGKEEGYFKDRDSRTLSEGERSIIEDLKNGTKRELGYLRRWDSEKLAERFGFGSEEYLLNKQWDDLNKQLMDKGMSDASKNVGFFRDDKYLSELESKPELKELELKLEDVGRRIQSEYGYSRGIPEHDKKLRERGKELFGENSSSSEVSHQSTQDSDQQAPDASAANPETPPPAATA